MDRNAHGISVMIGGDGVLCFKLHSAEYNDTRCYAIEDNNLKVEVFNFFDINSV